MTFPSSTSPCVMSMMILSLSNTMVEIIFTMAIQSLMTHLPYIAMRVLDDNNDNTVQHGVECECNKAVGRNYMFHRYGKYISPMKVA